jgi:predicted enzyme related to lactoylglutathione lyase
MFTSGDKQFGGLVQGPKEIPVSFWLPYVLVSNVEETTKKAKSLGAKVHVEPRALPGLGTMAAFSDPTGAHVAVWRPEKK